MAHAQEPDKIIAVALVLDSSLVVAKLWHNVLEYLSNLLKRLSDMNTGFKFKMAVVVYSTSDHIPSPLLSRRFFADSHLVTQGFRNEQEQTKLGVGQRNCRESQGMAALDGLVAAVEMFDTLNHAHSAQSTTISQLIHITASTADKSTHPRWNEQVEFDQMTWETLPTELKKRNVSYSLIALAPPSPRFTELHSAAFSGKPIPLWFAVATSHTLMLSGYTNKVIKRPAENLSLAAASDSKRQRLSQLNADSPPKNSMPFATQPSPVPAAPQPATSGAIPVSGQPVAHPGSQKLDPLELMKRLKAFEAHIQQLGLALEDAKRQGDTVRIPMLQDEYNKKIANHHRLKAGMLAFTGKSNLEAAAGSKPLLSTTTSAPLFTHSQATPNQAHYSQTAPSGPSMSASSLASQFVSNRGPATQIPSLQGTQISPNISNQMQKLIQQQERNGPQHLGLTGSQSSPRVPPNMQPTQPPEGLSSSTPPSLIWQGQLSWSGTGSDGLNKECSAAVMAFLAGNQQQQGQVDHRAETWPRIIGLVPSRGTVLPDEVVAWVKHTRPIMVIIRPSPSVPDPKENEQRYQTLVQLLVMKKVYAVGRWMLPSALFGDAAIFFPLNGGIMAAVSPLQGFSELPGPSNHPFNTMSTAALTTTPMGNPLIQGMVQGYPPSMANSLPQGLDPSTVHDALRRKILALPASQQYKAWESVARLQQQKGQGTGFTQASRGGQAGMLGLNTNSVVNPASMPMGMGMGMGMVPSNSMMGVGMSHPSGLGGGVSAAGTGQAPVPFELMQSFRQQR